MARGVVKRWFNIDIIPLDDDVEMDLPVSQLAFAVLFAVHVMFIGIKLGGVPWFILTLFALIIAGVTFRSERSQEEVLRGEGYGQ